MCMVRLVCMFEYKYFDGIQINALQQFTHTNTHRVREGERARRNKFKYIHCIKWVVKRKVKRSNAKKLNDCSVSLYFVLINFWYLCRWKLPLELMWQNANENCVRAHFRVYCSGMYITTCCTANIRCRGFLIPENRFHFRWKIHYYFRLKSNKINKRSHFCITFQTVGELSFFNMPKKVGVLLGKFANFFICLLRKIANSEKKCRILISGIKWFSGSSSTS